MDKYLVTVKTMNTASPPMYEWNAIPWKKVQRSVFKLQKRIYQASKRGDCKTVHNLQKLLTKSQAAKLLAVRKVTQDNRGKKTAGIDGVKALTDKQRVKLAHRLSLLSKVKPVRRVWIPKPYSQEKRPLGIPTMADRAVQALVKLALEPEWEAKFEPNSYGFRPGRSAHDAIAAIFTCINQRPKYILDADIEKCFDRINHQKLISKLNTFASLARIIRYWLKAGVLEGNIFLPLERGTPQGGVISPLLANIALHGMEEYVGQAFRQRRISRSRLSPKITLIRYADDFVVLHENRSVIEQCRQLLSEWLAEIGLVMKASKTRIAHTLEQTQGETSGFEFLGMEIRQYRVGKTHSGRDPRGNRLGFKTIIKPGKAAQKRHVQALGEIMCRHKASPQQALIRELNPVIKGWCQYYSTVVAKDVFSSMDFKLYQILRRWALRRHNYAHRRRIFHKYWRLEKGTWRFETMEGVKLKYHSYTVIKRYVKVLENKSPLDGKWSYWGKRLREYPLLSKRQCILLKQQRGKCPYCRLNFTDEDILEEDHKKPRITGGKNDLINIQILHRHCHDVKSKMDGSYAAQFNR